MTAMKPDAIKRSQAVFRLPSPLMHRIKRSAKDSGRSLGDWLRDAAKEKLARDAVQ